LPDREIAQPLVADVEVIADEMMLPMEIPAVQLAATFQRAEAETRVIVIPKCPKCGGETKVSSTRKAFRWHKCLNCGKTMKTAR
jgi:tRNA(Ile2) C34 agmatinyltransferase TiaS